ncbi:MAG: hypothetical protein NZ923_10660, partial [Candidatus Kryptonium sp.]|nr:hypothetical protein [Candidatus Kryptonium sp.]
DWREREIDLGNLAEKYNEFKHQKIIYIRDKVLERETIFNLSRKARPQPQKIENIPKNEKEYDPFCHYETETPLDELGRLQNEVAVTSANISKMADYHSLTIFKKHQLEELNEKDFEGAIDLSLNWFEKIKRYDEKIKTSIFIWNYHYRGAASILHPHFQLLAYIYEPINISSLSQKLMKYHQSFKSHYLDDYSRLAISLGIGKEKEECKIWFSLTPPKERGLNIYGNLKPKFLWKVIKALVESGTQSFNLFYIVDSTSLKNFGFFVDRGSISKLNSDFGSLEIFGLPVVSTDPFELAKEIFSKFSLG